MAKVIELHVPIQPTGKEPCDPASASIIALGNKKRKAVSVGPKSFAANKRAKLNSIQKEIADAKARFHRHESEFKEKCGGKIHVPPLSAWVVWLIYAAGFFAECAIASGLLDYSFLQGRAADASTFLEHFEGRGFFEGLVYAISDYSTQKGWAALGTAVCTFVAAKITGTWICQREAKRTGMPTWTVITVNALFLALCLGYVVLRHASMVSNPDSADFAYLAPVFLPIQLFFYAVATYVAAWLADPDKEATRLNVLMQRERKLMEKLIRQRSVISAEVTSVLVAAQAECDQIASQAIWDISSYRHANLKYRDQSTKPPVFLVSAIGPEFFEPIAFDPPPEYPADPLDEILSKAGTG